MSVVVVNESEHPFYVGSSRASQAARRIDPDEVMVLSDAEWEQVSLRERSEGGLRVIWPIPSLTGQPEPTKQVYAYDDVNGSTEVVYSGTALQSAVATDETWTVKKLTYDADNNVTEIQVLQDVAWDDREELEWS